MFEYVKDAIKFLYDRRTRKRILGYRPTVICLIQNTENEDLFLFIRPAQKSHAWMAPQEGIEATESIEDAAIRCLEDELSITENKVHYRRSVWLGVEKIPEQTGERDVEHSVFKMRGKAYYAALIKVSSSVMISCNPSEVAESEWLSIEMIRARLNTNSDRKQKLIKLMFSKLLNTNINSA
ncbi:NUDIX hydrolase [Gimesia benthica]|uniref:NUDIX hydrolase n=1 Tax=Gimesia benthica TaxID=2608982 RepID=A0A6I6AAI6_9PLAN|nr:NUDIX hydrolase [Gimesia benthica]QGQ22365.1 NUDIX hydrolase [Gimesia benthica]